MALGQLHSLSGPQLLDLLKWGVEVSVSQKPTLRWRLACQKVTGVCSGDQNTWKGRGRSRVGGGKSQDVRDWQQRL